MERESGRHGLVSGFLRSAAKFPDRPALDVDGRVFSYRELAAVVLAIGKEIAGSGTKSPFAAVLAYRSPSAYAGILGALAAGKGYVPLNPTFPVERLVGTLEASGCDVVVVGREALAIFTELARRIPRRLTVILPDLAKSELGDTAIADIRSLKDAPRADAYAPRMPAPDAVAYLLFTSGSTGVPKGVPVTHRNARAFVDYVCDRYGFDEHDRFSQTADMNFDLSVLEIFPCWERGSCLCCVPKTHVMAPANFIRDKKLTVWVSVPSVGIFMSKMRLLRPGAFPTLRWCLFCGEPLLVKSAEGWQEAAPAAVVENLYGPTEATVAITTYRWDSRTSPAKSRNGVVPIGWAFEGQQCCVIDEAFNVLGKNVPGELCLGGSQVTAGYFNNPEKTNHHYVRIPSGGEGTWYRTGDLAVEDDDGCFHYIGRIDNQVKILGYRVELGEVDAALRSLSGSDLAVSVPETDADGKITSLVGFVCGGKASREDIIDGCRKRLPAYMVPRDVVSINEMPLSSNGKIDRMALAKKLRRDGNDRS